MKSRISFGGIYSVVYGLLAFLNVGPEGQGTIIFFAPLIPWFLLCISLFMLDKLGDLRNKIFFVGVMILHYGLTLLFLYPASTSSYRGKSDWERGLEQPGLLAITTAWYLLGQLFIWMAFFKGVRNKEVHYN